MDFKKSVKTYDNRRFLGKSLVFGGVLDFVKSGKTGGVLACGKWICTSISPNLQNPHPKSVDLWILKSTLLSKSTPIFCGFWTTKCGFVDFEIHNPHPKTVGLWIKIHNLAKIHSLGCGFVDFRIHTCTEIHT